MSFAIEGSSRALFRQDILDVRHGFSGTDAAFACDVLRISLNTYKKCIRENDQTLLLKVHILNRILKNCRLNPSKYGIKGNRSDSDDRFGGYAQSEFMFLAGRYVKYRRSLLTGRKFNRSSLEIRWNENLNCLSFVDVMNYQSDLGVHQSYIYSGDIYIHQDRRLFSMLSIDNGEVRNELVHLPNRPTQRLPRKPFKMQGIQLTHGFPRGIYLPTATPILIEELLTTSSSVGSNTIGCSDAEYQRLNVEFKNIEESTVVVTSHLSRV